MSIKGRPVQKTHSMAERIVTRLTVKVGEKGTFHNLIKVLAREAHKIRDPSRVTLITFDWGLAYEHSEGPEFNIFAIDEDLDDWFKLAMSLAMHDILQEGKDANVCVSELAQQLDSDGGQWWGMYSETGH